MTARPPAPPSLAERPWPLVPRGPLLLVPVGAVEQHGPHLPLTTDTTLAVAVTEGAAQRLQDRRPDEPVLVAPAIAYTASGEHQSFPGTISIGGQALHLMLVELVRSAATWCGRVVFVNAHGGNLRYLSAAVAQLRREQHDVAWVPCGTGSGTGSGHGIVDAHAGFTETSLMLHLAPHQVDMTRAAAGNTASLPELLPAIRTGGVAAVSPSGVLGDPTTATARDGEHLLNGMITEVCALVEGGAVDTDGRLRAPRPAVAPA
ncbi:mycofactocin biosynthesis peptidyl-dipeptidase MftE [Parafrankia sp. FMc2]|uniref:mycofactocin biosynthesis peptidyl-dipeptidase MftE n=1 Tax=Parafrankia sp. FMc2 TaxID=3233196 RepID=UPI0034D4AC50